MPMPVAVIGAGWAGLSAALALSAAGCRVHLVEASRHLGGRARTLNIQGAELDNGQHVIVGACHATLELIGALGGDPDRLFAAMPLALQMHAPAPASSSASLFTPSSMSLPVSSSAPGGDIWRFAPRSTRPLDLLAAFWGADPKSSLSSRLRLAWGARGLLFDELRRDIPVRDWLRQHHQSPHLQEFLWDPLCIAIMNTPPEVASAGIFQNVLRQTLLAGDDDARVLIPRASLGRLLPEPAERELLARGVEIHAGSRVLAIENDSRSGFRVRLRSGQTLDAGAVIVAVSVRGAARLLREWPELESCTRQLDSLAQRAICTAFLHYPMPVEHLAPLTGLVRQLGQWVVPRAIAGEPNWLAVVISAAEPAEFADHGAVIARLGRELEHSLPGLGRPDSGAIVCEKQATLDARVGLDDVRPNVRTPVPGLYLGADFCTKGLPSTLEAAVLAGQSAAAAALLDLQTRGACA
jgi:squalene-associated FAD-dependent desaturase